MVKHRHTKMACRSFSCREHVLLAKPEQTGTQKWFQCTPSTPMPLLQSYRLGGGRDGVGWGGEPAKATNITHRLHMSVYSGVEIYICNS